MWSRLLRGRPFSLTSWVCYDFESLQKKDDHWPVILTCEFAKHTPHHWTTNVKRKAARPPKPQDSNQQVCVEGLLNLYCSAPWHVDVDAHYDSLADFWNSAGSYLVPKVEHDPVQPYISPDSLNLIKIRQALRRYLRSERTVRHRCLLMFGFVALRLHQQGNHFDVRQLTALRNWFVALDHSEAEALFRLMHLGFYLRKLVTRDRNLYLARLAADVKLQDLRDPSALYASVRKAFPAARSGKRSTYQPLPAIQLQDGSLAVTSQDRSEAWRQHFAQQEAGELVSPEQYVADFAAYARPAKHTVFDLQVIPTLPRLKA